MGPEYTCVLDMCLLPKKGTHTLKHKFFVWIKHRHMSSTFSMVSLSMELKLSLPLSMSAYLEWIALYVEHVKSKWHSSCTMPSLHTLHVFKFVTFWYHVKRERERLDVGQLVGFSCRGKNPYIPQSNKSVKIRIAWITIWFNSVVFQIQ